MARYLSVALAIVQLACQTAKPRYIVTTKPLDVGVSPGLCVALDPSDGRGLWWWEPGDGGCSSRSTGPDLVHPSDVMVSRSESGAVAAVFQLGTHSTSRPFVVVRLVVTGTEMLANETGSRVPVEYRTTLDITERPVRR